MFNQNRNYNYVVSLAGVIIFFLLIYLAGYIEQRLQLMAAETYQGLKFHLYGSVMNFAVLMVATSALGLSRIVHVRGFDWKLFGVFAVSGVLLSFIPFLPLALVKIPLHTLILVGKYSKMGGVIAGVGIIMSARTGG